MEAGLAVVDVQAASVFPRPTTPAGAPVAGEHGVTVTVKAGTGMKERAVAGKAEAGAHRRRRHAAPTKQRQLRSFDHRNSFSAVATGRNRVRGWPLSGVKP